MPPSTDLPITRRAALAAGVAAASTLAGCLSVEDIRDTINPRTHHSDAELGAPPEPWPTAGHDARRTGSRETETTLPESPTIERVGPGGDFYEGAPMVDAEAVYAPIWKQAQPEYVRAFVATGRDGESRWRHDWSESSGAAAPTLHGGTAFLTRAGETMAVDRLTGEIRWTYAAGTTGSTPTAVDDHLYLGANSLLALDGATGERLWRADDVPDHAGELAATADTVFAESDGTLFAIDAADGSVRWQTDLEQEAYGGPVVGEKMIAFMGSDGLLQVISRSDQSDRWTVQFDRAAQAPPAIADGVVYVVDESPYACRAYDAASGEELWDTDLGVGSEDRPAVDPETVYVPSEDTLDLLDRETGEIRRRIALDLDTFSQHAIALADDAVFFVGIREGESGVYRVG
ncbi:PQQ-binding-like beta-propeller repeat protein [Halolamina salifodinae]|uniref:Outer membrane protein assembly factor BamB n=2 Tax=Halolamina salifodinae TaxID=1202767 RepID=A0A8T4GXX4_9EURY|nr:PQQ-binding-like beta-propeller repeat protein [Halolamina salifodinae]MBP1987839.1 outer membrane protein assembly factor BamB [Halolamina salifodinae]